MNKYMAYFDFITADKKGRFVGRSGYVPFETKDTIEKVNADINRVENLCVLFIHEQKPKWNVLMITVKAIIHQSTNTQ